MCLIKNISFSFSFFFHFFSVPASLCLSLPSFLPSFLPLPSMTKQKQNNNATRRSAEEQGVLNDGDHHRGAVGDWRRPRSELGGTVDDIETTYVPAAACLPGPHRRHCVNIDADPLTYCMLSSGPSFRSITSIVYASRCAI